jgi:hypothetical protein
MVKAGQNAYADPDTYPIDARGLTYSYAYIGIKRLGAGQFYLISIRDKEGEAFDGSKTYRLTVPPNPPGRAVLVGNGLRPTNARADQEHVARQPLIANSGDAEERRRLGRCLFRPQGSG